MICQSCSALIQSERETAIRELNLMPLCLDCAAKMIKPVKGVYPAFSGQNMIISSDLGREGIEKIPIEDFEFFQKSEWYSKQELE